VKSRGKKAKTDAVAPAAAAPPSKAKKGVEKKAAGDADDEAAKEQQEADEVDALADEPAENGPAVPGQGALLFSSPFTPVYARMSCVDVAPGTAEAPNATGPNATPGGVVIEATKVEAVISQAA
jgi:hypothetical protein